jgi:hypothetical protein
MYGHSEYRSCIIQAGALARAALASAAAARLPLRRVRTDQRRGEREQRSYRRYCAEQQQAYREFSELPPAEQRAYWRWRDTHDSEL